MSSPREVDNAGGASKTPFGGSFAAACWVASQEVQSSVVAMAFVLHCTAKRVRRTGQLPSDASCDMKLSTVHPGHVHLAQSWLLPPLSSSPAAYRGRPVIGPPFQRYARVRGRSIPRCGVKFGEPFLALLAVFVPASIRLPSHALRCLGA